MCVTAKEREKQGQTDKHRRAQTKEVIDRYSWCKGKGREVRKRWRGTALHRTLKKKNSD